MKCWAHNCLVFNLTFLLLIYIYIYIIFFFFFFFGAVQGPMYNVARHGWCAMKVTG